MEMRNRDEQIFYGIIGKIFLKFSECLARFFHDERRSDEKRRRIVDKPAAPPEIVLLVNEIIGAVLRFMIMQHVPLCSYARRLDLRANILGNGNDVVHHFHGIFKHVRIYSLQDVIFYLAVAVKIHFIRLVDVPAGNLFITAVLAFDGKISADSLDFCVGQFPSPFLVFISFYARSVPGEGSVSPGR